MSNTTTIYEAIGGAPTIRQIVEAFYPRVKAHPLLDPIFPEDLTETIENQYMFLTQFFGGPGLYTEKKGHPMLRARHMPFEITPERAEAWLTCMNETLDEVGIQGPIREQMWSRLAMSAYHMVNS
ncbi:hemoglobin [Thermoactinomyces sp. DSM 45891]|uniref:globin domain-containing protein n=1 Tax=Thermoactinomyces sp. DSM 45891 TaxID=1761907 RepID=UPI000917D490|nr:globin [Thermoactinomyces sp. DSM 45891]SFX68112.1 hemoglobin [Thermoactinomyces sp. DSM 45891]